MGLTVKKIDALIARAKAGDVTKALRVPAANKLFLLIQPSGAASWRYQYQINGRRRTKSHGPYPEVTLKEANRLQSIDRALVRSGVDPLDKKPDPTQNNTPTFKDVALMWHDIKAPEWKPSHAEAVLERLEKDLFIYIGRLPIDGVSVDHMEAAIKAVQARPAFDLALRARARAEKIFKYAKAKKLCRENPAYDITEVIRKPPPVKHHPAPVEDLKLLGKMLADFDRYPGRKTTQYALRLAPLLIVRPGELRSAQWAEFDLDAATWTIPGERMKMGRPHVVPLSRQALRLLKELSLINTGKSVFPSDNRRTSVDPFMSESTVNQAIARLGYKGKMVGHGVRTIASTLANDSGRWTVDAVEKQLAHGDPDKVRGAYNRAEKLQERREMMQWLADEIDRLKIESLLCG